METPQTPERTRPVPRLAVALGILAAATVIVTTILARPTLGAQQAGIAVGQMVPTAMVESLDGRPMDLIELTRGKPAVFEFWATWCPLCRKLEPAMERAKEAYGDRVTFVGIGVSGNQTRERQRMYVEANRLRGVFVFDRNDEAVKAFSAPHTSYIVVVDSTGRVVYTGVGERQDIDAAVRLAIPAALPGRARQPLEHGNLP